jgi:uncharacterized membrane protein
MTMSDTGAGTSHVTVSRRHPVVVRFDRERADDVQLRLADRVTAFAGSMAFVWLHVGLFALWMVLVERSPWPTLTLIVSLEAIFLSTFVLIGQNRQAAFQQAKADHDFTEAEQELRTNTELTRELHEIIVEMREHVVAHDAASPAVGRRDRVV